MNVEPGEWFPDLKLSRICLPVSAALHLRSWGGWRWRKGKKRTVSLGSRMGWGTGHSIQKQDLCMRHGEKPRQNANKLTVYLGVWHNCKNTNQALVMEVYDIIVSAWNLAEYCPICFNERMKQFLLSWIKPASILFCCYAQEDRRVGRKAKNLTITVKGMKLCCCESVLMNSSTGSLHNELHFEGLF